jgi:ABC-2 type transport system permease protein
VNWQHLSAFIWLRYRLRVNQLSRSGIVNQVILSLFAVAGIVAVMGAFFGGLLIGLFAFRHAQPVVRMWVWDGLIVAFLFSWMIGLLTELQRTDGLALDRFLHLPVSPFGAFLINYISSLFGLSMILFVPGMIGLILGQAVADGPQMLLALPLLAAFVLAVTALTYQFQGWLATLMTNPRRRRSVIVMVTISVVLMGQLPNLVNIIRPWNVGANDPGQQHTERLQELSKSLQTGQINYDEYQRQLTQVNEDYQAQVKQSAKGFWDKAEWTTRILNTAIPPAWLSLGAADLAAGAVLPALLGGLALGLIGALSLRRAYRTTMRMYSGYDPGGKSKKAKPEIKKTATATGVRLIEWRLPWLPEQATAVAVSAFRSILRAPEAKMTLILPIILTLIFGSVFLAQNVSPPSAFRPLIAFGAMATVLLCAVQLVGNQFGYDRAGFRAYVLSPVPRREILLGKNMAVAPIAIAMIALILIALECLCPMRVDYFLMAVAQGVAMFLLFCLLANGTSILAPIPIAPGSMKASQVKLTPVLAHMALMFLFPLVYTPLLIPYGIETLLSELTGIPVLPIALPMTLGLLVGVVFIYRNGLNLLGRLLTNREQKILEIVTSKSE